VRITPDEVHLSDPDNYEVIYHVGSKYSKSAPFYSSMGAGYSTFSTMSNDLHRIRRARLNPFFSRKMVLELEDIIQTKTTKLCDLVAKKFSLGQEVDLHHGFRAVAVDIITDYAFNQCYDLLDRQDFGLEFFFMIQGLGPMVWAFQQWPILQRIALAMPKSVAKAMSPPLNQLMNLQEVCSSVQLRPRCKMTNTFRFSIVRSR
jgi:cytochrome P450